MKVKAVYQAYTFPNHYVVETLDGRYMAFRITPYRNITEDDLTPMPAYRPAGNNAAIMPEYEYRKFGIEVES